MFCHNCGGEIPNDTKFCRYCGAAQGKGQNAPESAPPVQPQQASWQAQSQPTASQEHVLPGIFGAFLCSLAGVAVMVLLNNMGYVSSLSGIVMLACTVWGYSHFSKAMSKKGIIFSVLIVIAMIYVGNRLCWAIMFRKANSPSSPLTDILFFFRRLPLVNLRMVEAYQESLIQQYAFAAVGVIFLVINLVRGNRAGKKK